MFMTAGCWPGDWPARPGRRSCATLLFAPLGMESTIFSVPDAEKDGNFAQPYD